MELESIFSILDRLLILSGVFIVLFFKGSFIGAVSVYPIVESVILAASVVVLFKRVKNISMKFSRKILATSLKESSLFFLGNVLIMVFLYVDSVMLSKMKDEATVGLYNASYNIIYNLRILVSPFIMALFPAMSLHAVRNKEKLLEMYYKVRKSIFLLGLAVTVIGFVLSKPIILILYGDNFRDSVPAFSILILAIPAIYLNGFFGYLLTSLNYQKEILKYLFIACVINIVLNAVFIPAYGFIGASVITVISEIIVVSLCYMKLCRIGFR
jgi:O-antigen/teichoic acid export membrane protein